MDKEKKIKLDELPDMGGETGQEEKPRIIPLKPTVSEPRLEKLKGLEDSERLDVLSRSWHFDRPVKHWNGIIIFMILIALQYTKALPTIKQQIAGIDDQSDGFADVFVPFELDFILRNPLILVILLPVFFKFKEESEHWFEVTFSGIKTVQNVFPPPRQVVIRVFIHWDEIVEVKKTSIQGRTILLIKTAEGPIGEIIWDIDDIKKEVIQKVLRGIVNKKHPMMIFLEKDIL